MNKMTALIIVVLTISNFWEIVSAETYLLGSHSVDLNLSVPADYIVEPPIYRSDLDNWIYELNITPNTGGYISIEFEERSTPVYSSILVKSYAESSTECGRNLGIGSYRYGMTTYHGYDAYEESYPAQILEKNGYPTGSLPETYTMMYQLDELTEVLIQSIGAGGTLYHEVLDSMEITKYSNQTQAKTKPQNALSANKPYIGPTSTYAGTGKGAKLGMEDQNIVTMLGDSQSSNITVSPHGVK